MKLSELFSKNRNNRSLIENDKVVIDIYIRIYDIINKGLTLIIILYISLELINKLLLFYNYKRSYSQ